MSLRWFGKNHDSISLKNIGQIPGIEGVVTSLYEKNAGEIWPFDEIKALKKDV